MKSTFRPLALLWVALAAAATLPAANVDVLFRTEGYFGTVTAADLANPGFVRPMSSATVGDTTRSFIGAGQGVEGGNALATVGIDGFTVAQLGAFSVMTTGTSNDFFRNVAFTLAIFQVSPSNGQATIAGLLNGRIQGTSTSTLFYRPNQAPATIGNVTYEFGNLQYPIGAPDTSTPVTGNGFRSVTSLQGTITAEAPEVPEPGTYALMGGGLLLTAVLQRRYRRSRQQHQ